MTGPKEKTPENDGAGSGIKLAYRVSLAATVVSGITVAACAVVDQFVVAFVALGVAIAFIPCAMHMQTRLIFAAINRQMRAAFRTMDARVAPATSRVDLDSKLARNANELRRESRALRSAIAESKRLDRGR